jgi:hypothetical protein
LALGTFVGLLHVSAACRADGVDGAASVDLMAGVEGGQGAPRGVRRTRTTLRAGVEGWLERHRASMLALSAVVEIEPDAALGADLRYRHRVLDELVLDLGPMAIFVPETLVGGFAGIAFRPRLSQRIELEAGARGGAFFAGSDLPDGKRVIGQGMLVLGLRVGL